MLKLRPTHIILGLLLVFSTGILASIVERTLAYPKISNRLIAIGADTIDYSADLCDFSTQENLFPWGDFGSGTDTVVLTNPQLCPGHGYTTAPPPNDGYYTITNNISNWDAHAEITWINIGDNSPDPNGYMMVLNMHPDSGTVFQHTFDAFCENTTYEFSIDVINLIKPLVINWADAPDIDIYINDQLVHAIGEIPQDSLWHTHAFQFTNTGNLDDLVLSIKSNNLGTGGRDMAIDNISLRRCMPTAEIITTHEGDICEGETVVLFADIGGDYDINSTKIQWEHSTDNGLTWTTVGGIPTYMMTNIQAPQSGWYRYLTATTSNNLTEYSCSVISDTIMLNVSPRIQVTNNTTICVGDSIVVGDNIYFEEDNYQDVLTTENGCDSIVFTNLEVLPLGIDSNYVVLCEGDLFFGNPYFSDTLIIIEACDSLIYVDVYVNEIYNDSVNLQLCEGELYNGIPIHQDTTIIDSLLTYKLCDSITVAEISVFPSYENISTFEFCEGYYHAGNQYFSDTLLVDTLQTITGCDSIISTQIIIHPLYNDTIFQSICMGEMYEGLSYTQDTVLTSTNLSSEGCDSISVINLTVHPTYLHTIQVDVCEEEIFENKLFTQDTVYTDTLQTVYTCDSLVIKEITFHPSYRDTTFIKICGYEDRFSGNPISRNPNPDSSDSLFVDSLQTTIGCDSLLYTSLSVFYHETYVQAITICPFDTLSVGDSEYTQAGTYRDTLLNGNDCDSLVVTFLRVSTVIADTLDIPLCRGDDYQGTFYQNDTTLIRTANGVTQCDSIIYTLITLHEHTQDTVDIELCEGEVYQGNTITQDTAFWDNLQSDFGCDSLVYKQIYTLPNYQVFDTVTLSQSQIYAGQTYQTDTLLTDNQQSIYNCDSIIYTQIIVLPNVTSLDSVYVCEDENYNGTLYQSDTLLVDTLIAINGSDSLAYTQLLFEANFVRYATAEICSNDSIYVADAYQNQSGQYIDVYLNQRGCDSIVVTDLVVHPSSEIFKVIRLCPDEMYNSVAYNNDTTLVDIYNSYLNCDSIINTLIKIHPTYSFLDTVYVNEGDLYQNIFYPSDTLLIDNQQTINSCDSILQTQIIIRPTLFTYDTLTICEGTNYNGVTYFQDAVLIDTLTATTLADSIDQLNIYTTAQYRDSFYLSICQGDSLFLANNFQTLGGIYIDTLASVAGCDSIIVSELIVLEVKQVSQQIERCDGDGVFIGGEFQYTAGMYLDTLISDNGCDSIVTSELIINPPIQIIVDTTICEGESYQGVVYFSDTTYLESLQQVNSCDSIVINIVNVMPIKNDTIQVEIQDGDAYNGVVYTQDTAWVNQTFSIHGCDSTHSTFIKVLPKYETTLDISLCEGEVYDSIFYESDTILVDSLYSILQTDSVIISYIFVHQNDTTYLYDSTCDPMQAGLFLDTLSNQFGCDSLLIKEVTALSSFNVNRIINICEGDTYNDVYYPRDTLIIDSLSTIYNCDSIVHTEIILHQLPEVGIVGETVFCEGEQILLSVAKDQNALWSTGDSTMSIVVRDSGWYSVMVTSNKGCTNMDSVWIAPPLDLQPTLNIEHLSCQNEAVGSVTFMEVLGGEAPFLYGINGSPMRDTDQFENLPVGDYTLRVQDINGCEWDSTISILPLPFMEIELGSEQQIVIGDSLQLEIQYNMDSTQIKEVLWMPANGLSCTDCLQPMMSPEVTTLYTVIITMEDNCQLHGNILLKVIDENHVYIPSAFSPNDDGINDYFTVFADDKVSEIQTMLIFDRWGNELFGKQNFQPNDIKKGWNGSYKNKTIQQGVYIYYIKINYKNGETSVFKGDLTILF